MIHEVLEYQEVQQLQKIQLNPLILGFRQDLELQSNRVVRGVLEYQIHHGLLVVLRDLLHQLDQLLPEMD